MWGGPLWTAADALVGLRFDCFVEPNQAVRRGRGVRPTQKL